MTISPITPGPSRHGGRLVAGTIVGCLLAVPAGWLLATLILLPFMLGLFFYMLLGLLLGAVVFRIGSPAAPVARPRAVAIGLAVTLVTWSTSLAGEYLNVRGYSLYRYGSQGFAWYPVDGDATRCVRRWFPIRSFTPRQIADLRAGTRRAFLAELKAKYPPGGFVGFLRWSARPNAPILIPRVFSPSTETCRPPQSGPVWIVRLIISLLLLTGAVLSQVLTLTAPPAAGTPAPPSPPDAGPHRNP